MRKHGSLPSMPNNAFPKWSRRHLVKSCTALRAGPQRCRLRADSTRLTADIGRALLETPAVPLEVFDPYGEPPPFAGRLEMIGMGKSRIEDAFERRRPEGRAPLDLSRRCLDGTCATGSHVFL
jgi:hypothetical protein